MWYKLLAGYGAAPVSMRETEGFMYRLGEVTDRQRVRIGAALLVLGAFALALGVFIVHWALYPETVFVNGEFQPYVVDYFNWMPRGWIPKTAGYLVGLAGSQFLLGGAALIWILNQKMTWARAAFAAFLAWIELVIVVAIVPSEWLNLAQTDLDWSSQRIAFTIPPWLVLGNEIDISFSVLKDAISGGYNTSLLVIIPFVAYQLQKIGKPRPASAKKERVSPYGRPLVKGES